MTPAERDQVVRWLTTVLHWDLVEVERKPQGRSIYHFIEQDADGWSSAHRIPAKMLRWRYMLDTAVSNVPSVRKAARAAFAAHLRETMGLELP